MKVLAKLLGKVNVFNPSPEFSYVTLKNIDNGEVIDSNAVTEKLVEAGITKVDDVFEVIIIEDDIGKQTARLTKLKSHFLSTKEIEGMKKNSLDAGPSEANFDI